MGLFRWFVKLGECGEFVSDGYVYAKSEQDAEKRVKEHYTNQYHNVLIIEDWEFDSEDADDLLSCNTKHANGVLVRWED